MSLVIGFSGMHGAVMAGDHREILFFGDASCIAILENGLSNNLISTEHQLRERAAELGVIITIRDDKCKVREKDGILIGEVTETDCARVKRRRLCISCGRYVIGEKISPAWTIQSRGEGSHFLVLGNQTTKDIALRSIRENWKQGRGSLQDAVKIILLAMQETATRTASVSKTYTLVQTRRRIQAPGSFHWWLGSSSYGR